MILRIDDIVSGIKKKDRKGNTGGEMPDGGDQETVRIYIFNIVR